MNQAPTFALRLKKWYQAYVTTNQNKITKLRPQLSR